uniref:Carboxylesterase type B domain-containing protein n=1 Tax=Oryzias latipes TaxID=8090 RepID=A0A3B3ILE9_ORYLA
CTFHRTFFYPSWRKWLGRGKSGHLCLDCCPRDSVPDKRRKMDGDGWISHVQKTEYFLLLTDSGVPVYLYEYQYPPSFLQKTRPSFVKCDHGDELFTVLGFCFTTTDVKINAKCTSEEEELSKLMMNYWGNFARTGSPNAKNLAHWPKYGADEEYLIIALNKQTVDQSLKKERFLFATEVLPEKIRQHKGNEEHTLIITLFLFSFVFCFD